MQWLRENPGPIWQWIGLAATVAGTALTIWAVVAARSARAQARLAVDAANRLVRIVQVTDLVADLQELESLVARGDLSAIAAKANHLRGRIARFRSEAYDDLTEKERNALLVSQENIQKIPTVIAGRKQESNKLAAIEAAIGDVNEFLNVIAGTRLVADKESR